MAMVRREQQSRRCQQSAGRTDATKVSFVKRGFAVVVASVAMATAGQFPAAADANPRADASEALAQGDGVRAATIIVQRQWSANPVVLADLIYDAGAISVARGRGEQYSDGVPVAFLRGGVSFLNAEMAFRYAAATVVQRGVTPGQARAGALAVAKTNAAYAGLSRQAGRT